MMKASTEHTLTKVPEATLAFWLPGIAATTLGETGDDAVSISMSLDYLMGTGIFTTIFLASIATQIKAKGFHPFLYWTTIIAATTVDTMLTDFASRSLGIGYAGGSTLLLALLLDSLSTWYRTLGSASVSTVHSPKAEALCWVIIMFSQTLGTTLGDWTVDTTDLGYTGAAVVFGALLALIIVVYCWTHVSRTLLFWVALILIRPLGAVINDFLDKPHGVGGLALSRYSASAALLAFILTGMLLFRQRAARVTHWLGVMAGGHMRVLLVELLGFIPVRFSVDIGGETGYRYSRAGALGMAVPDPRRRWLTVPPGTRKR